MTQVNGYTVPRPNGKQTVKRKPDSEPTNTITVPVHNTAPTKTMTLPIINTVPINTTSIHTVPPVNTMASVNTVPVTTVFPFSEFKHLPAYQRRVRITFCVCLHPLAYTYPMHRLLRIRVEKTR